MNGYKRFHFALLATLLVATALPAAAKKGDGAQDCDDTSSDFALQGSLAVKSSTQLNACTTVTQVGGVLVCSARGACPQLDPATGAVVEQKEEVPVELTITSNTVVCADGTSQTFHAVGGTVTFVSQSSSIWWNGNSNPNPGVTEVAISGVISPGGQVIFTLEEKKGLNAVNVKLARMAAVTGTVLFNPKEYSMKATGFKASKITFGGGTTRVD